MVYGPLSVLWLWAFSVLSFAVLSLGVGFWTWYFRLGFAVLVFLSGFCEVELCFLLSALRFWVRLLVGGLGPVFSVFFSFRGFAFRPSGVGVRVLSMGLGF